MIRGMLCSLTRSSGVQRAHSHSVEEGILVKGERDRIDPDKWRPLIMSFQQFYGLAPGKLHESTLAKIPESLYRPPPAIQACATHSNVART